MNQPTQVKALKEGKPADKPIYNPVTGLLDPPERIDSPQILIIEGLHPFFDDRVNDLVDFRIYLDISGGWCRVGCVGGGQARRRVVGCTWRTQLCTHSSLPPPDRPPGVRTSATASSLQILRCRARSRATSSAARPRS